MILTIALIAAYVCGYLVTWAYMENVEHQILYALFWPLTWIVIFGYAIAQMIKRAR